MKATASKVIIYDDTCPMCSLYTNGFIKGGFLPAGGRMPFAELTNEGTIGRIDLQRAKHEIPLVDMQGGETMYGVDSLVFILNEKLPFVGWMMKIGPVNYFVRRLYRMISYNRRIIIPSHASGKGIDCTPGLNMKYRTVFIAFAIILSSLITWLFGRSSAHYLGIDPRTGGWQMLLVAGTGWVLQIITALLFMKRNRIDYLGHVGVVMIIGVLLLLPGIVISSLTSYSTWLIPAISVLLSSIIMLWQHLKRVKHTGASQVWTASWFLYLQSTAFAWVYVFYLKDVL